MGASFRFLHTAHRVPLSSMKACSGFGPPPHGSFSSSPVRCKANGNVLHAYILGPFALAWAWSLAVLSEAPLAFCTLQDVKVCLSIFSREGLLGLCPSHESFLPSPVQCSTYAIVFKKASSGLRLPLRASSSVLYVKKRMGLSLMRTCLGLQASLGLRYSPSYANFLYRPVHCSIGGTIADEGLLGSWTLSSELILCPGQFRILYFTLMKVFFSILP